ncbi:MAG: glycosyltransferase family 4 protein [Pseudobdellovibrionaceae bacterium]
MAPPKPYTVLQVIPNLGAGGAEQTCVDVTAALVAAGHKAIVVSNGGPRVTEIQRAGGLHIEMPVHSKNPLRLRLNARRLRSIIDKYRVDIVHARSRAPAWSAFWACEKSAAKFMTTCHAPYNIGGSEWKRKYNAIMCRGELVIANSDFVGHYLVDNYGCPPAKIRVIPRGIPLDKINPHATSAERLLRMSQNWRIPEVATVVLLPGRLTRWKGQLVMIDAMAQLGRKDVYCVLLGDDQGRDEYRDELEALIAHHHLEERVRIAGHCSDMATAYMLADVVVSASIEPEGFGRVAVEGQAMGRPVVATNIGGSNETIIPNVTGFLVPPDNPEALAGAVRRALAMPPAKKAEMGQRGIEHVQTHFSKEQMTYATLLVYEELLAK